MSGFDRIEQSLPFSRSLLAGTALTVVMASTVAPALAQTAPAPAATQMPAVTTEAERPYQEYKTDRLQSNKYTEPLLDTPQSFVVIPRVLLDEQNVTTVDQALRNVPGITIGGGEGGGAQGSQYRIRGSAGANDTYVDGIRDTFTRFGTDAFNLEGIEVGKGGSGTYNGRGTTGGFINQVSKQARLENFYAGGVSLGTDWTRRATADVNHELGFWNGAVRLNAVVHDQDVAERDDVDANRWGIAPTVAFGIGTADRLNISLFHLQENKIYDYGQPTISGRRAPVDRSNSYMFKDLNTDETDSTALTAKYEHDFDDMATLRSVGRYSYNTRYAIVTPPRNGNIPANTVTHNPTGRDIEATLLINQTDIVTRFKSEGGQVGLTLNGGLEVSRESYDTQSLSFAPTAPVDRLFNPNTGLAYFPAVNLGNLTETLAHGTAGFGFGTLSFGEYLDFIGGARIDRYNTHTSVFAAGTQQTSTAKRTDVEPSWRLGVVGKPVDYGSIYFTYSTSFNPSAEEVAITTGTDTTPPETNSTYEFGTKWEVLDRKLALTGAVFWIDKNNARSGTDPITGDTANLGKTRTKGAELGATGYLMENWQVFANYSYLNAKILESATAAERGKNVNNVPRHAFSIWSTYDTPFYGIQVGAGVQFVGHRHLTNANTGLEDGAYAIFDAMVSYPVTDNIKVQLNGYNLGNTDYIASAHAGGAHYIPGAGRSAILSTSFKF
jgi:catecholate siderophore receptor